MLTFFSGVTALQSRPEIETIKQFNPQTDTSADVNWKKTAQTWQMMSNSFNKDTEFSGKIVSIPSHNRHKWYTKNIYDVVDDLTKKVEEYTGNNKRNHIALVSIPRLPSFQNYFLQKTIIISDFFRSQKQINECLQACKDNKLRCIVIPLVTDIWIVKHPLQVQYPQYFRSLDL